MDNSFKWYVSACDAGHGNFLNPIGGVATNNIDLADVIIFGGGSDVDPATYNEKEGSKCWTNPARDRVEKADFKHGLAAGKKMFGICRGHQFLCAMAGGKLIQDVSNHNGGEHRITTFDGNTYKTNSIHHQMINPDKLKSNEDYRILAWSTERLSKRYLGPKDRGIALPWGFKEIEAVYFPKINSMGVQYHPEMMYGSKRNVPVVEWTQNTFLKFLNNQL